jgi:hypothetical protein
MFVSVRLLQLCLMFVGKARSLLYIQAPHVQAPALLGKKLNKAGKACQGQTL